MSQYIDGFVLSIPKDKLAAYKKLATKAGKIWREHGALEYRECVGDDLDAKGMVAFPKLAKSKPGEVVIFAYAVFESRKQRDAVNKKIMTDPRMTTICGASGCNIDYKRMAYGGFKSLVQV
jgi:uncharacterized protein YbaA (DUF1428 family)